jgi:hypothetical protein
LQIVNSSGKYQNRYQGGGAPDISHILMFYWFEPVLYLDPVSKFQFSETKERPGYFVRFADNVGDALTFKILKNNLITVLHRSVVRSGADASHRNRRVSFKSDLQESLKLLDNKPSLFGKIVIIIINQEILIMICQTELGLRQIIQTSMVAIETRSKMNNINILSVQNLFFPLHDAILFQEHGNSQEQDLQLGVVGWKVYQSVLMNTKSQVDFDCFWQLHMLDKAEEDNDKSWECHKVVDYCKEKGDDHSQITSVWWNGMISIRLNNR